MSEMIEGRVSAILFCGPSKYSKVGHNFICAKVIPHGTFREITVKGEALEIVKGATYKFYGDWKSDSYGPYLGFSFFSPIIDPGKDGTISFLDRFIKGVGIPRAKEIVATLGDDALSKLRQDPSCIESVTGIPESVRESVRSYFVNNPYIDPVVYANLIDFFKEYRIERRVIDSLIRDHGSSALDFVKAYPYRLLGYRRIGFLTVDKVAINKCNYDPNGIDRQVEAIREALTIISNSGHTHCLRVDVENKVYELITMVPSQDSVDHIVELGFIERWDDVNENECWALAELSDMERSISRNIQRLSGESPLGFSLKDEQFNRDQCVAASLIERQNLCIVTGSAGTGKTFLTANCIRTLLQNGFAGVAFAAPTGKAAKRGLELFSRYMDASSIKFSTIHNLLGPLPTATEPGVSDEEAKVGRGSLAFDFKYSEDNPLPYRFIVIDEASMCDVEIFSSLLEAIPTGCRVLIVGDPYQLPSVGPGSVLRDLIAAGVPCVELSEVRRNSGAIVNACQDVRSGQSPEPCDEIVLEEGKNWVHIEADDGEEIKNIIGELVANSKNFDKMWGIQVISPQKTKHPFACDAINELLSNLLNPDNQYDPDVSKRGFAKGDKVVRTKNELVLTLLPMDGPHDVEGSYLDPAEKIQGYYHDSLGSYTLVRRSAVNGDMGIVRDFIMYKGKKYVIVDFIIPERTCFIPADDHHLIRAYAMTVHKAQGSGFPLVICPVHTKFYWDSKTQTGLFNRELLYTMLSRAEKCLITVGQRSAIDVATNRKTVNARNTRLPYFMMEARNGTDLRTSEGENIADMSVHCNN